MGGVILEIPYGLFKVFSPFLPKNHARVVKFSYLNFAPLNLYPTCDRPNSSENYLLLGFLLVMPSQTVLLFAT